MSFVALLCDFYDLVDLLFSYLKSLFLTGMTKKSKEKGINNHLTTKTCQSYKNCVQFIKSILGKV